MMYVEALRGQPFLNKVTEFATDRNPALLKIEPAKVTNLARQAALEIAFFEEIARTNQWRIPQSVEEAKRIKAIWDLSAVGTYLKEFQDDRWKGTTWAGWTDRRRLNYAGTLMRRLTEKITGKLHKISLGHRINPQQASELQLDIEKFGPYLIYGATVEQNEDLAVALGEQGVIIPGSKVHIIDFPEKPVGINTIDQMRNFSLPPSLQIHKGDILSIVAHAPHMVRALHMAAKFKPFPEGLIIQPYPLPSPLSAGTNSAAQEISGLLYYTFITGDSSEEPYPYQI